MSEKGGDQSIRIVVPNSRKVSVPEETQERGELRGTESEQEKLAVAFLSITKSLDEIGQRGFIILNGERIVKLPVQPSDFEGSLKLYEEKLREFVRWFDDVIAPRQAALEKRGFKISLHRKLDIGSLRLSDYQDLFGKIASDFDALSAIADASQAETLGEDAYLKSVDDLVDAINKKIESIANKYGYRLENNRELYEELERRNNIKGLTQSALYSDLKVIEKFEDHLKQ